MDSGPTLAKDADTILASSTWVITGAVNRLSGGGYLQFENASGKDIPVR